MRIYTCSPRAFLPKHIFDIYLFGYGADFSGFEGIGYR